MEIETTAEDRTWKEKLAAMKPRVNAMTMKANDSLRGNPAKWTGIAAGAGLGVGLLGRFLKRRANARHVPAVIIIEAAC